LTEFGFASREAGRDQFEIAGIPQAMIEAFSKRSQQIKARVGPDASAAQKEVAALATRRDKASVPTGDDLEKRWKQELAAYEIDPWTVAREAGLARNPRPIPELDHDFDPPEITGDTPVALAASGVFRTENVLTRKALLHRSFVESALQGKGIKTVYSEVSNLEASGRLVRLDDQEAAQHWTTTAIAAEEAKLLRLGACPNSRCSILSESDSSLSYEQVFSPLEYRSDTAAAAECAGLRAERPCLAVYR
jgi:hypothetical protein